MGADNTWFTSDDISANWSAVGNPYQYTGQRYNPGTELMYYKNRYFDTDLGRFLSRDPIGYKDGLNFYEYVKSNPVRFLDSEGTNIYLKEGNDTGHFLNDILHQAVCVDDPCFRRIVCFSFGMDGWMWRWSARLHWLGWRSYTLGNLHMKGRIYEAEDVGRVVKTKITTPAQDKRWLQWMQESRVGTEDVYSARHSCRTYSQWEFKDAP